MDFKEKVNHLFQRALTIPDRLSSRRGAMMEHVAEQAMDRTVMEMLMQKSAFESAWLRCQESILLNLDSKVSNPYKQNVWIYASIQAIARNLSQLPFRLLTKSDDEVKEGPIWRAFHDVNPLMSRFQLWEATVVFLETEGNCFWWVQDGKSKNPYIWTWNPATFKVARKSEQGIPETWERKVSRGRRVIYQAEEIVHFKYFNPEDSIIGMSPMKVLAKTTETDWQAVLTNLNLLKNDSVPRAIVIPEGKINPEALKRLQDKWQEKYSGSDKAGKMGWAIGIKDIKQLRMTPRDMEYLDMRKMSREEVTSVEGVPPGEIGILDYANYANLRAQLKQFWEKRIIPLKKLIEDKLETDFFRQYAPILRGEFDTSGVKVLQEDINEQTEAAYRLWQMGATFYEINEKLDLGFELDDKPWTKEWWIGFNLVPASSMVGAKPPEKEEQPKQLEEVISKAIGRPIGSDYNYWKAFVHQFSPLERAFTGKLRKWLMDQREGILARMGAEKSIVKQEDDLELINRWLFNLSEEAEKLKRTATPYIGEAIANGGQAIYAELGLSGAFTLDNPAARAVLTQRVRKLVGVAETVKDQIKLELYEGLREGESINQLANRVRTTYNMASTRAKTISRTEVIGSANEGRHTAMKEQGIKRARWIVAADDEVLRESHRAEYYHEQNAKGTPIDEPFPVTGLQHPGDPSGSAEEVINCRCVERPIVEV